MGNSNNFGRSRLSELSIRNLGVIEEAAIEFAPGLNVVTGETGAGKTMVLTALSLVAGEKSDSDLIRLESERLSVTGIFELPSKPASQLKTFLEEQALEIEDSIILTRIINKDGKSRASISGVPTTVSKLADFSDELMEIHGQHGAVTLTKSSRQRDLLDNFGGERAEIALAEYMRAVESFQEIKRRLQDLDKSESSRVAKIQELETLLRDEAKLKPKSGELKDLENKISILENLEDLRIHLSEIREALTSDEYGALRGIDRARRALAALLVKDEKFSEKLKRAESAYFDLSDLANEAGILLDELNEGGLSIDELLERKAAIKGFAKKHGGEGDIEEQLQRALERAMAAKNEIADLSGGDDRITALKSDLDKVRRSLIEKTGSLSKIRIDAAARLTTAVTAELNELAMPNARFFCQIDSTKDFDKDDFPSHGTDEVTMKFSAHQNGELLPISKVASGGELSRLMLAIEVVAAGNSPLGTYLFDEVDAGIGGKAALEVGKRLKRLASTSQVIVVTHLPQVAIWADHHLVVNKDSSGSISESSISIVTGEERETEIARMLSGVSESEHAQEHARELLNLGKE